MVALPSAIAVTMPPLSTAATFSSLLLYETSVFAPVSSFSKLSPALTVASDFLKDRDWVYLSTALIATLMVYP